MSTNESATQGGDTAAPVAKEAPTEQQSSRPGTPKRFEKGQTVCNEKNEKGKLCNGHLKQVSPVGEDARQHLRGDDLLYRCQTCGALYMGPPLGHVRDPQKQSRYVERELAVILQAAGGTLPAFKKNEAGAWIPVNEPTPHAALPSTAPATTPKPVAAKPAPPAAPTDAPSDETPEQKRARIIAEVKAKAAAKAAAKSEPEADGATSIPTPPMTPQPSPTSGADSSPAADAHRPAAEAQAATGQASAAPLSPAASTASPAAGAETPADLAPEASTELTPGAPADESAHGAGQTE